MTRLLYIGLNDENGCEVGWVEPGGNREWAWSCSMCEEVAGPQIVVTVSSIVGRGAVVWVVP